MMEYLSSDFARTALRLAVAALLGGVVGLERDIHGRAAGLRTHMLVSLGAAVFTVMSFFIAGAGDARVGDPGRVAAQIVTGIGFLGAGAILKEQFTIRGLTTAACLWVAAGIGMASGAGRFAVATFVALLSLFSLTVLRFAEHYLRRESYRTLSVTVPLDVAPDRLFDLVRQPHVRLLHSGMDRDYETRVMTVRMWLRLFYRGDADVAARTILRSFEESRIPIKRLTWDHS